LSVAPENTENLIDETTAKLIRVKSRQIVRQARLPRTDREDLEQQLTLHLLARLPGYDPAIRPRDAHVRMLLRQGAATVLRSLRACKRCGPAVSLSATLPEEPIDREGLPSDRDRAEVASDVAEAVASLPAELREIAELLTNHTVAELVHRLGVSRSTLYRRVADIRATFEARGLGNHLE
jgi:RNA polymerase sigma-70 factor (ECF subfamily)